MNSVFNKIENLCLEQNITSEQLCAETNISLSSYYSYRVGRRTIPDAKLQKIANYLGVSTAYLLNKNNDISYEDYGAFIAKITNDSNFIEHALDLYSLPEMDKRYVLKYISLLADNLNLSHIE